MDARHALMPLKLNFNSDSRGVKEVAFGGGLEGAERTQRETALWSPSMASPDQIINRAKPLADARGSDLARNDGYTHGALQGSKDSIVGAHYRLNATPVVRVLQQRNKAFDEVWAEEYQEVAEAIFNMMGDSDECWFDASGRHTVTEMVRVAIGSFGMHGEFFSVGEWLSRDRLRPLSTAIQMISPSRVCNPNGEADSRTLTRGIQKDKRGRPVGCWIRVTRPGESWADVDSNNWQYVPYKKPWGRRQVLHAFETQEIDQSRGIADLVAVLKPTRMAKTFSETALQNVIINASYAAALEADMPPETIFQMMGGQSGSENLNLGLGAYMSMIQQYFGGANNIKIDGAMVPVLPPGVKMNARSLATPGGLGSDFEESLHRNIAAGLGSSYEEYTGNWKGVSYSGGKMAVDKAKRYQRARKKFAADKAANFVYSLFIEEAIDRLALPLPRGVDRSVFYEPLMKDALVKANWIGTGFGQIDEFKETQAAIMRIKGGLSTREIESARLGFDWRDNYTQLSREQKREKKLGLLFSDDTTKKGSKASQQQQENNQRDAA